MIEFLAIAVWFGLGLLVGHLTGSWRSSFRTAERMMGLVERAQEVMERGAVEREILKAKVESVDLTMGRLLSTMESETRRSQSRMDEMVGESMPIRTPEIPPPPPPRHVLQHYGKLPPEPDDTIPTPPSRTSPSVVLAEPS